MIARALSLRMLGLLVTVALGFQPAHAQQLQPDTGDVRVIQDAGTQAPYTGGNIDFPRDNPAVQILSDTKEVGSDSAVTENYHAPFWKVLFDKGSPFYFGLSVGETYDDNIFISQVKHGDFYTHVTPLIDFVEGDKTATNANYFNAAFRPTLFFYDRLDNENRVDYYADGVYQHTWERLKVSLEQRYEELTDASIDVGNFFKRDIYTTDLQATYDYNDSLSFGGSETQQLSYFSNQAITSTGEWITDLYARYQLAPKLILGLGPKIGVVDISGAPDQAYQDALVRLTYAASQKVNVQFDGGAEHRRFDGSGDRIFPIFDFMVNYTPFDGTLLSLSGYRNDVISYSDVGDDYLSTLVQLNVRQRFLEKFFFLLSGGYNLADYQDIAGSSSTGQRRDNYYFVNVGLEWDPREWLNVSLRAAAVGGQLELRSEFLQRQPARSAKRASILKKWHLNCEAGL